MQRYKINRARHAAFLLHVHLVFVTKYRLKVLGGDCKIICVNGIFSKTFKGLQNAYQQRSY
ncbi:hypothetical protein SODG_005082 [Sodalis praecaptivus]